MTQVHSAAAVEQQAVPSMGKSAGASFQVAPFSTDPVIEAENFRLHTIHDEGYEANFDGTFIESNPYPWPSIEFSAWHAGHRAALEARDGWEEANHERASRFA